MIDPKMIPREARVAATKAQLQGKAIDEIIAAALNAWPRMTVAEAGTASEGMRPCGIILPLPKEGE